VQRVFFGPSREPPRPHGHGGGHGHDRQHGHGHDDSGERLDLRWHELVALAPLAVFVLWIGLVPGTFLAPVSRAVRSASDDAAAAFAARMAEAAPAGDVVAPTPAPIHPASHAATR